MQNIPLIAAQILSRTQTICQFCTSRIRSGKGIAHIVHATQKV